MKKLTMFILGALIGTSAVMAQDSTTTTKSSTMMKHTMKHNMGNGTHKMMKDCIMMKDNKLMVMKSGKSSDMDQAMTLANGTIINTDGSVKMKDGSAKQLKNGDGVYMNGKMMKSGSMNKMHSMHKKREL